MLFLYTYSETSIWSGKLREESDVRLTNLKESVGLILTKVSFIRVTIPIDLSTWSFIPLPRFFNSVRGSPLLNQSWVLIPSHSIYYLSGWWGRYQKIKPGMWGYVQDRDRWSQKEETHMSPRHNWLLKFWKVDGSMNCVEKEFKLDPRNYGWQCPRGWRVTSSSGWGYLRSDHWGMDIVTTLNKYCGLCARSWFVRHPAKIEITGSSGVIAPHQDIFFFYKDHDFLDF